MPKTQHSHDAVFTVVDQFSKLVTFILYVTSFTAEDIAQLFFDHVVRKFGMPNKILNNHNPGFVSKFWTTLMAKLGSKLVFLEYHPQADGWSNRFHRSVEHILQCVLAPSQDDWGDILVYAEFELNLTIHSAYRQSTFKVVYRQEPSLPIDHAFSVPCDCKVYTVIDLIQAHHDLWESVQSKVEANNKLVAQSAN